LLRPLGRSRSSHHQPLPEQQNPPISEQQHNRLSSY
jgi:hypothetical protein